MFTRTLLAATLAAATLTMTPAATVADSPKTLPACVEEDGSGQRVCVWDARHMGNGSGHSFIARRGGTDDARYVYITHKRAHRLAFGGK